MSLPTLTEDPISWRNSSLLSVTQMTPSGLNLVLAESLAMRQTVRSRGKSTALEHVVLGTVFFEASTRTACSFQAAIQRLGGSFVHVDGKGNTSAGKKGETLEDTIRCLECYTDATVLRHGIVGSAAAVAVVAKKPVINAGDGVGEHPTQALLDVFTIYDELGMIGLGEKENQIVKEQRDQLVIVLLGDLKHGRTVHSLAKLLVQAPVGYKHLTLRYCAPAGLDMPNYVQEFCAKHNNVTQEKVHKLEEACRGADVLYVTRVQRERFESDAEYDLLKGSYVVDAALMKEAPSDMVVLHPLPRVDEIAKEVDTDPRAAYFRQMENGMFVRMALLSLVLSK